MDDLTSKKKEPPQLFIIGYGNTYKVYDDSKIKNSCIGCEKFIRLNYYEILYLNCGGYYLVCKECFPKCYSKCGNIYANLNAQSCVCKICLPPLAPENANGMDAQNEYENYEEENQG